MKGFIICLLTSALCMDLAQSLRCYFCQEQLDTTNCKGTRECPQESTACKIFMTTTYGIWKVSKDCAPNCEDKTDVLCCRSELCNDLDIHTGGSSDSVGSYGNSTSNSNSNAAGISGVATNNSSAGHSASDTSYPHTMIGPISNFTGHYSGPVSGSNSSASSHNNSSSISGSSATIYSTGGSSAHGASSAQGSSPSKTKDPSIKSRR